MEFFRSIIANDITAADGTVNYNLNIRPTSHLVYNVKVLNAGANTKATLAQILSGVENIQISRFGQSIISISGADLYALNCILLGHEPWQENVYNLDNSVRCVPLIIPFGRKLYNPKECMPANSAGELVLQLTLDIADTGYDGMITQIAQVELPGATPEKMLKYCTKAYTPGATGAAEVDLPRGNPYDGILLWGTTVPTGIVWTTTIDKIRLLVNNEEHYYGMSSWLGLHSELINLCDPAGNWSEKIHLENSASAYTQNADTAAEEAANTALCNYSYLNFDPANDDNYLLDTAALAGLKLEVTAGDTNPTRITPVELMKAS